MKSVLKIFNYQFYVGEFCVLFFCYLLMEPIFSWLFMPSSAIVQPYYKISSFLIYGFMVYSFAKLRRNEKIYTVLFSLYMVKLVMESLFQYDTVFRQLSMFYVLFPVVYALFIKYICRIFDFDILEFLAQVYLFTYIVFMALYGRGFSFSLEEIPMDDYGPFSGDGRIIHAGSIFMMVIPFLWYLNKFITTRKNKFLIPLFFCAVVILIHQHRSVWSCTILATLIYIYMMSRTRQKMLSGIGNFLMTMAFVAGIAFFFVSNMAPDFIDFLGERFSAIFEPAREGSTGTFRVQQREVYFALFLERPIFGWTFEGFEMPNPLVDWWPPNTGQHFHEGYMEMLFYHGIAGFLLKYSLLFYIAFKVFSKKLSDSSIILVCFCVPGLLFSFNYVPGNNFWGNVGLCLYYLERDRLTQ